MMKVIMVILSTKGHVTQVEGSFHSLQSCTVQAERMTKAENPKSFKGSVFLFEVLCIELDEL